MGYIIVIARVARDLWQRKQTLSSGCALGLGWFTAINPWPRAITITYILSLSLQLPVDDYDLSDFDMDDDGAGKDEL